MALIKTADMRLKERKNRPLNIVVFGPSGVGKTFQAGLLDPKTTLFIDLEGGTLAIEGWAGDVLDVREMAKEMDAHPWLISRYLCLLFGGHDPAAPEGDPYSKSEFDAFAAMVDGLIDLKKYKTIFIDSITVASRHAMSWAQTQPEAWSEKKNAKDMLGAYGLLGREMIRWITHWQHSPVTCILVGILDEGKDEFGRKEYSPQIEGSKAGREIPGIFDEVLTLMEVSDAEDLGPAKGGKRRFVTNLINPLKVPAKDRSGTLELYEPANIQLLLTKIRTGVRLDKTVAAA